MKKTANHQVRTTDFSRREVPKAKVTGNRSAGGRQIHTGGYDLGGATAADHEMRPASGGGISLTGNSDISTTLAPGVGFDISGGAIDRALAPDEDERQLIDGARDSAESFYGGLGDQRDSISDLFTGQADQAARQASEAFSRMAENQANQDYSNAVEQQTYAAYRGGNTQGSANAKQMTDIYKTSQAQRIANAVEARRIAEKTRQNILAQERGMQDAIGNVGRMGARSDANFLNLYQQTRPDELSELGAYLEDTLVGLNMGSGAAAEGVDNAYDVVF